MIKSNTKFKGPKRTASQVEVDRKARIARKQGEQAYTKTGSSTRERVASYFMRRNRLTSKLRQALSFIEGRWTPKHHTKEDEQHRRQLRYPAAIIMEANRFQGSKTEGQRQRSIEQFLTSLFKPAKA